LIDPYNNAVIGERDFISSKNPPSSVKVGEIIYLRPNTNEIKKWIEETWENYLQNREMETANASDKIFTHPPESGFPEELGIGSWEGYSAAGGYLWFNVEPDGSGVYTLTLEEYDSYESYAFTLEAGTSSFSVQIPDDLYIMSIEGTYTYANGTLTLDVQRIYAIDGYEHEYSVSYQIS
jgi:hypothetical protein